MTDPERRAREIVDELHEYGFGGDPSDGTISAMKTLTKHIAAALAEQAQEIARLTCDTHKALTVGEDSACCLVGSMVARWDARTDERDSLRQEEGT